MKVDYFADLLRNVPGVPGSDKQTGSGSNHYSSKASPVSPVSPEKNILAGVLNTTEQTTPLPSWCRAKSYPCLKCGGLDYTQTTGGWKCNNCLAFFEIIGGMRGPQIIH